MCRKIYPGISDNTVNKRLKEIQRWARRIGKEFTRDLVLNVLKKHPPKVPHERTGYVYKGKFLDAKTANTAALKNPKLLVELLDAKHAIRHADGRIVEIHPPPTAET